MTVSAAVVISAGLFALGVMRPVRFPAARAELEHLAAARRLAVVQAEMAAAPSTSGMQAPPAYRPAAPAAGFATTADPTGVVPPVPAPSGGQKPFVSGKHYRKFDHL